MKFNWDQSGMPVSLVSRIRPRNEFAEFKTVLNDAQNQVMTPVDAEAMAKELVQSGGRDYVEMVRELSESLANARKDLEDANSRYERLVADLAKRGISISEDEPVRQDADCAPEKVDSPDAARAEWDEWDRRFQSLLG